MMTDREEIINELVKHIESALDVDSDYVDCVRTDLLQYTVALLTEQDKVMGQAVVITTMHDLPEGCLITVRSAMMDTALAFLSATAAGLISLHRK